MIESRTRVRRRARIRGLVQGVGFRPFAHALAARRALAGFVANDDRGVVLEVEGDAGGVDDFLSALVREAPPLAIVEAVEAEAVPVRGDRGFAIVTSRAAARRRALVSPDIGVCDDCVAELFDPADRRFGYPFTNCTNCGPRFTIVTGVPYDRPRTTMARFALCADCAREYADPADRRFHAEPISCPACGPTLALADRDGRPEPGDPIAQAAALLRGGAIVAVKGLGGYHLAVLAFDETAVAALRAAKHRDEKAFALMVRDLDEARALADLDDTAARSLVSPRRPIVLVPRRPGAPVAGAVAPGVRTLGLMLPYTPLHHLLCRAVGAPLVLTSGNRSDEPIAFDDADARARLAPIAGWFLTHDRPIHVRTDDSVVRAGRGRETVLRRARGFAPQPIGVAFPARRPILACGAELKSTFCLLRDRHAFLSPHLGDLHEHAAFVAWRDGIEHFQRLFDVRPEVIAHDLHPDYRSTRWALAQGSVDDGVELVGVQHHHAHVAACLAEHDQRGLAIGVAFDGLGYGTDGTLWGGEFLVADVARFERAAHLAPVPMPGGTAAIRQPWRMAAAYLTAAGIAGDDLGVVRRNRRTWDAVVTLARTGLHAPPTSSAGRLFDGVAALLGVRDAVSYEGQAAMELETLADEVDHGTYDVDVAGPAIAVAPIVAAVVDDVRRGVPAPVVAARFHDTMAALVVRTCRRLRDERGLDLIVLTGGVFQNVRLLDRTAAALERRRFRVLTPTRVPPNDGGISFGQAAVAAARMERDA